MKNTLNIICSEIAAFEVDSSEIENLQNFKFELEACGFTVTTKDKVLSISMRDKGMSSNSALFAYSYLIPKCKTFSIKIQS